MTVCSPWQWFCSTRTLSNCVENTYTVVALECWPWRWSLGSEDRETVDNNSLQKEENKDLQEDKDENPAVKEVLQEEDSKIFVDEILKYIHVSTNRWNQTTNLSLGSIALLYLLAGLVFSDLQTS